MIELPINSEYPSAVQTVNIANRTYRIAVHWNTRSAQWCLDLFTSGGEPLIIGQALRLNYDVLLGHTDPRLPQGHLLPIPTSNSVKRIGRDDLGDRVRLVFVPR